MTAAEAEARCRALTSALARDDEVDVDALDRLAGSVQDAAGAWARADLARVMAAYDLVVCAATRRRDAMHRELTTVATGGKAVRGYGRPNATLYTGQRLARDV